MQKISKPPQTYDICPDQEAAIGLSRPLLELISQPFGTEAQWCLSKVFQECDCADDGPVDLVLHHNTLTEKQGRIDLPDDSVALFWFQDETCLIATRRDDNLLHLYPIVLRYNAPDIAGVEPWILRFSTNIYPEAAVRIPLFFSPGKHSKVLIDPHAAMSQPGLDTQAEMVADALAQELIGWSDIVRRAPALLPIDPNRARRGTDPDHGPYDWSNALPFTGWSIDQENSLKDYLEQVGRYLFARHSHHCATLSVWVSSMRAEQGSMQTGHADADAQWRDIDISVTDAFNLSEQIAVEARALLEAPTCPVSLAAFVFQRSIEPRLSDYRIYESNARPRAVASVTITDEIAAEDSNHQRLNRAGTFDIFIEATQSRSQGS